MSDLTIRVAFSFLVAVAVFFIAMFALLMLATAPAVLLAIGLFGAVWAVLFSMIHVRPKS